MKLTRLTVLGVGIAVAACGDATDPDAALSVVGHGEITEQFTSDLWVHGSVAYTGTWNVRGPGPNMAGNTLWSWDVSNPESPVRGNPLVVDARGVNDVKVRADGAIGVITHEASEDSLNGVTLFDLSNPLAPTQITRFTSTLNNGVHNAWIEGDFVYLAVDGASPNDGLRILDISDPQNPTIAASFYGGSSFLHDVYVRDGLAFLSHWDAGLIILDVGNGMAGGSPGNPVEVSRLLVSGGQTHNAWYWPATGYIFVGEEDFGTPGVLHVIDGRDLTQLTEVATYAVSGAPPHNHWLDETNEILYVGWYGNGLWAIDVSGELMGELDLQGREIASSQYADVGDCPSPASTSTCSWAPQLHNGDIYVSDLNTGLWVLRPGS